MIGFTLHSLLGRPLGLGDVVQCSSIPENYFRHTGKKLIDVSKIWVFDKNPYIVRDVEPERTIDLWYELAHNIPRRTPEDRYVYLSTAETFSRIFGNFPVKLNRPRLYHNEQYPFNLRSKILLHTKGVSQGNIPEHVIKHVLDKYGDAVEVIGREEEWVYKLPRPAFHKTDNLWDLAELISKSRMVIGPDSGPAWIGLCYHDVVVKKIRTWPTNDELKNWIPLECCRIGSYFDDRAGGVYNCTDDDAGFTWSYRRL